jgi:phasin family protein
MGIMLQCSKKPSTEEMSMPTIDQIPAPSATEADAQPSPVSALSVFNNPMEYAMTVQQIFSKGLPSLEDVQSFAKGNIDAMSQAGQAFAHGVQQLSQEVAGLAQTSFEQAVEAGKQVLAARTLSDVVRINADYTKSSTEALVANSAKLGELGVKVANDAFTPVARRLNAAVETFAKPAA